MNATALRRCELCAVDLLCRQHFTSIYDFGHMDLRRFRLPVPVTFESSSGYAGKTGVPRSLFAPRPGRSAEGLTLRRDGDFLILYDDLVLSERRLSFTLAHEIGHIMLGHIGEEVGARQEQEAGAFAAALLCPAVALRYLEHRDGTPYTTEKLTAVFPLSAGAAACRLQTLRASPPVPPADSEINLLLCLFGRIPDTTSGTSFSAGRKEVL